MFYKNYYQLYLKKTSIQVFFSEHYETFKNTYFEEHLRKAGSRPSSGFHETFQNIEKSFEKYG